MKVKLAIITVHAGDIKNLIKTIKSVDSQNLQPDLHLIISKTFDERILMYKKKNNRFIFKKDNSIYNAMNIGLKYSKNYFVFFLNSGDYLYSKNIIKIIKKNILIYKKKCLNFKTILKYKNQKFLIKDKIFYNNNFYSHPSFVRPPSIKPIYYNENFKILSDGMWMAANKKIFGVKKIKTITAVHNLGGISSNPSFFSIKDNFRFSVHSGIKEIIKFCIKIFSNRRKYYEIIFKRNYSFK